MHFSSTFRHAGRSLATRFFLTVSAACFFISAGHAAAAPKQTPNGSGQTVTVEGRLEVRVEDYPNHSSRTRHFLDTSRGRIELKFKHAPQGLISGSRVRVHGQADGTMLALGGSGTDSVEMLTAASTSTLGQQRVAVVLVNFQDDTSQPITPPTANTLMFSTIDAFYRENSFQQTWLTGDVYGWVTIATSKTGCNTDQIAQQADAAVAATGIDLSGYGRTVYMFPQNACSWTGLAMVGGTPARAWINGVFSLRVVGHELGHTFGLMHAHGLDCDTNALGATCSSLTYGDGADLMGNRAVHFNPFEKEQLGWLNDGVSPPIVTVAGNGRYTIEPYSSSSVGNKALKIARDPDPATGKPRWYYIEYRQPIGADAILANVGNLTKGVLVRTSTEGDGNSSNLLDMTPNSITTSGFSDLEDGALAGGRSYTDAAAGVTISLASAGTSGAAIDVSFGGSIPPPTCTRAAPSISITGATTAVAAGSARTYTVSVGNKDSSACAATTFSLARSVPSGWTGTLAASSLSLSPGSTGTTTLNVTSPTTAAAGSYGIGVGTSSTVGSVHTANASTSYSVATTTSSTLTETVGTDKTSYLRGQTVTMSALVRNNGVAVNGASVKFTVTLPGGTSAVLTATSGSDGYARSSFKLGKGKTAAGSYTLRADASSGGSSATSSTGFGVL
jgi:hypothetical protein